MKSESNEPFSEEVARAELYGLLARLWLAPPDADLLGQFAFDTKFPVGVITGILGAPYLLYLLIRTSRRGGSS